MNKKGLENRQVNVDTINETVWFTWEVKERKEVNITMRWKTLGQIHEMKKDMHEKYTNAKKKQYWMQRYCAK